MFLALGGASLVGGRQVARSTSGARTRGPLWRKRSYTGTDKIVDHLNGENAPLVVLRASGGYELLITPALLAATGLPVAVVNSRQARDFARASG